jgi:hypothetical protein
MAWPASNHRRLMLRGCCSPHMLYPHMLYLPCSDSELEDPDDMSGSDAEEAEHEEAQPLRQRRRTAAGATAAAPEPAAAVLPTAEEGSSRRTTSGRAVRPPRSRLGEAAAVTSPDLAAAEAAQLAEYEAVQAIQRQQQLPALPRHISLFKAARALPLQPQPQLAGAAPPVQGALSTSSDASAYCQPAATAATLGLQSGSAAAAAAAAAVAQQPAYGVPVMQNVISNIEAGLAQLAAARQPLPGTPADVAAWSQAPSMQQQQQAQWALAPLPGIPLQ